jgi:hypothetical protein
MCYNLLYWQSSARKQAREVLGSNSIYAPERFGVNVCRMAREVGVKLEWPPRNAVWIFALLKVPS